MLPWEEHFQAYVHGNGGFQYMKQYEQPVKSLEELLEAHRKLPEVVEWMRDPEPDCG